MTIDARLTFEPTDPAIWSATFGNDGRRWRLCDIMDGATVAPGMSAVILALTGYLWNTYGSPLFVTTARRSWANQAQAHEDNPSNAVKAGLSMHQPGYAVDFDLGSLTCTYDEFVDAAARHGLSGISNEKWHKQLLGHWSRLYNRGPTGPEEAAMAMCFELGLSGDQTYGWRDNYGNDDDAATQGEIWRVYGPGCGSIDGYRGTKTKEALRALGLPEDAGYRDLWHLKSAA